jgi:hypothetical protein
MRILSAAAVAMLLTAPAYAQMQTPNINLIPELQSKSPEEKEQDSRRQDLVRSVGRGAQQRCAEDRRPGQAEDQDRQQRPAQPVATVPILGGDSESISAIAILGPVVMWSCDMVLRPRDLASRMAARRNDGYLRESFTLPREAARMRARDFLKRYPKAAYMSEVESWRELPGGDIEFTMRRLASAD